MPLSLKLLRNTVGRMVGILPGVADNEGVMAFLDQHPLPEHPDDGSSTTVVIVTRPGRVEEKEAASQLSLWKPRRRRKPIPSPFAMSQPLPCEP